MQLYDGISSLFIKHIVICGKIEELGALNRERDLFRSLSLKARRL